MHGQRTAQRQMAGQGSSSPQIADSMGGHPPGGHQASGQQMGSQQMTERTGGQQPGGHGTGGQQLTEQMGGQQTGTQARSFEDHMTDELRIVLEDFSDLSHVAAWCATECAAGPPELGTCARVCQDIAEIAELNEMLIARDSMFGPEAADMFIRVANEGLPELQQYQQRHSHVAETVATIERTMDSCASVLQQIGQGSQMGGQTSDTRMGGQQTGGHRTSGSGRRGRTSGGRQTGHYTDREGMRERGQHGPGTSGGPTGHQETTGQQY